jgi:8-oxo-dGTP pyrophosphatase MutT (NUDIX family)
MTGAMGRWCAAAVIFCEGRYLMQLRDPKPGILLPDHWALFGGAVDPGEDAATALRRELAEELEFAPRAIAPLTEMEVLLPLAPPRRDRMDFFLVEASPAEHAAMVQHEGAAMRLFTTAELLAEPRVSPWDLAAILMHARGAALFANKR